MDKKKYPTGSGTMGNINAASMRWIKRLAILAILSLPAEAFASTYCDLAKEAVAAGTMSKLPAECGGGGKKSGGGGLGGETRKRKTKTTKTTAEDPNADKKSDAGGANEKEPDAGSESDDILKKVIKLRQEAAVFKKELEKLNNMKDKLKELTEKKKGLLKNPEKNEDKIRAIDKQMAQIVEELTGKDLDALEDKAKQKKKEADKLIKVLEEEGATDPTEKGHPWYFILLEVAAGLTVIRFAIKQITKRRP